MRKSVISFFLLSSVLFSQPDSVEVTFRYASPSIKSFAIAGSFNSWTPASYHLKRDSVNWQIKLKLLPSYYYYKFVVDGNWIPDPSNPQRVNDGGESFNSILKVGNPPVPRRKVSSVPFPKDKFPIPVLAADTGFVSLYYAALQMAWNKIANGTKENGFSQSYMDEGFNELIYQWDTNFMAAFGMYFPGLFPAMESLDNFYNKQREDGYIQRVYWESNGKPAADPTREEPMVNPPLFAQLEARYYHLTGDTSRLARVLPVLVKYFYWIEKNCRSVHGKGLYYTSPLGSGMDNTPRPNVKQAAYIDFSCQQALAAGSISDLARVHRATELVKEFANHHRRIAADINRYCWNTKTKFYFDLTQNDTMSTTKHIGAFWALMADVADKQRANQLVSHLKNPKEFWSSHPIPALSADDPAYDPKGHYWLGGVWAPTNYMVLRGLDKYGFSGIADTIALNYLRNIDEVYRNFSPAENSVCFEERYADGYHTIWECYSPEFSAPATRWDNTYYSRQDFVGWSGLGPIGMLFENILGFAFNGDINEISWRLHRNDRHGIENISFRGQKVSLLAIPSRGGTEITVEFEKPFRLIVSRNGNVHRYELPLNGSRKMVSPRQIEVIDLPRE